MVHFPNAKINLGLFITGKRPDGYHSIESIFYPIKISDILEIGNFDSNLPIIRISGMEIEGSTNDNLVVKAIQLIHHFLLKKSELTKIELLHRLRFHLHKIIPTGAGLGGGSSDGTFALKMINEKLDLNIDIESLEKMALELGSDCPFFVRNSPSLVKGRGEIIENFDLDLSSFDLILIHPGIHISTKEAYAGVNIEECNFDWKSIQSTNISLWKDKLRNDFEKSVFKRFPEIEKMKESFYEKGAIYAQMSGSGSAVFGIFEKGKVENLRNDFKQMKNHSVFTSDL